LSRHRLAAMFSVDRKTISNILSRKIWKHVQVEVPGV
jgi:hypothetical protein